MLPLISLFLCFDTTYGVNCVTMAEFALTHYSWKGGLLVSPCPSVRLSVRPSVSLQLMTSCCMNFAIIIQWIYFTIWEKIKKNRHHYNTILSFYNIKTLQEKFAKKSNIPWIWRIIYGHKLPYTKKTRKKEQVCCAACFMAAEIKFSKDVHLSLRPSVRLWTESCPLCISNNTHWIHFIFAHLMKQLQMCSL